MSSRDEAIVERLIAALDAGLTDRAEIVRAIQQNMPNVSDAEVEKCAHDVADYLARVSIEGGRDHAA